MFNLELNQTLKIKLSLEMKLSIQILEMSLNELKDFLHKKESQNPLLEVVYKNSDNRNRNNSMDYLENFSKEEESLINNLEEQIMYLKEKNEIKKILNYLINNLDERGYINGDLEELRKIGRFDFSDFKNAFNILRSLEPSGIGAINLVDCLKVQIKNKGIKDKKLEDILDNNLKEIAESNIIKISLDRSLEIIEVEKYIKLIKTLNPKPARGYFVNVQTRYIIPDLIVSILDENLVVKLNEDDIPRIKAKSCNEALILERCLEKRQKTLLRVSEYILNYQKESFVYNKPFKTLKIKDISFYLNLDKSTVSRAIKNKLLKINGKIKPLRGYIILDEKNEIIKNEIINIIKNEDKKKKLSDQEISNIFFREGKKIGRRTIAKYRNELGIFCSKKRK